MNRHVLNGAFPSVKGGGPYLLLVSWLEKELKKRQVKNKKQLCSFTRICKITKKKA